MTNSEKYPKTDKDWEITRRRRSECSVLPLVLEGRWYDMIASGKKREEYRAATKYWCVRLENWDRQITATRAPVVEFRRGYARDAARMAFWCFGSLDGCVMRYFDFREKAQHPEWGEPASPHFVIPLVWRIELED